MHFWIDIEFTNILNQFKQKKIVDLFMMCNFKFFFDPFEFKIGKLYIYIRY
jgi:hypothetical protein